MKTQASRTAHKKDRTGQEEKVFNLLLDNPGSDIEQLSSAMSLPKSTITARLTGLQAKGMICKREDKLTKYFADSQPSNWESRAREYARQKDVNRIAKFGKRYGNYLTPEGLQAFRDLYRRASNGLI
ncbi:MAG: helix-turn-helix domain-containing protein [Bacteroidota bacterium]